MLFLEIDGEVIEHDLQPGEKLLVNGGHIAAMEETVDFDVERVKGVKNIMFGGEGLFFTRLTDLKSMDTDHACKQAGRCHNPIPA